MTTRRINHTINTALTALFTVLLMASCSPEEALPTSEDSTSLALCVSTARNATRMSDAITQQEGTPFREIQDLWLFPFSSNNMSTALDGNAAAREMSIINSTHLFYFDDKTAEIPEGTDRFLCYARAVPDNGGNFVNGYIKPTITDSENPVSPTTITFSPSQIYTETTTDDKPAVDPKATAIANYLTAIAKAIPSEKAAFFWQFVNKGHPIAASTNNAEKLANWAEAEGITLPTIDDATTIADYPANISLPEGAAVVKWNTTDEKFEPQVETTTEANINSLNRFIYPAELYYYANSPIKTSKTSLRRHYENTAADHTWADVLAEYDDGYGVMDNTVKSVAINDPLHYAVGLLQIKLLRSASSLKDAAETPAVITLKDGKTEGEDATFPLTAVFVSGQYEQAFDFTPKGSIEYIIYDKETTGLSIGAAPTVEAAATAHTNTLVLQSKDGASVRFALEFTNNSGTSFQGFNGTVFPNTKFYLVGNIDKITTGHSGADEYKNRAFTKDYVTQGTVTISSLKQAYTYLPDLLDPRLEIGIQLVPNWIQATTTNVPL